jgi:L-methionine (R)-S-oxide reductase
VKHFFNNNPRFELFLHNLISDIMAESLCIDKSLSKEEKYHSLIPQINALIEGETDLIANMSNIASALYFGMEFFWVGFYIVKDNELVLGPFHGPIACTRIAYGKGVCGTAWEKKETLTVPDVDAFPGHIACSSDSRSEIVVCGMKNGKVEFVLDVDSALPDDFDETDKTFLEDLVSYLL